MLPAAGSHHPSGLGARARAGPSGGWRQSRDLAARGGRNFSRAGAGGAGTPDCRRADNLRSAVVRRPARRRRLDHALRNPRRRRGRPLRSRRCAGDPRAHVQCHEHARRGHRGGVPGAHRKPAPAPWLRRSGCPPGRRRAVPGVSGAGRAHVVDQHVRARRGAALWTAGRRAWRAVSGHGHPGER